MTSYVPSRYNRLFARNEKRYAFSCRTGLLAEIDDDATWDFLTGNTTQCESLAELEHAGLATSADIGCSEADIILASARAALSDSPLALQVAPTLSCNFRCSSCIQGSNHVGSKMSEDTQEALISFCEEANRDVNIGWYGGEPTLALDVIANISRRLIDHCAAHGHSYTATMTTNGYLIDDEVSDLLVNQCEIHGYQITLDGPPPVHNERRPHAGGGDSFKHVLRGIRCLHGIGADVKVRINVDKGNWDDASNLLDLLAKEGLNDLLITAGMKHGCESDCSIMSTPEFSSVFADFQRLLYAKGFLRAAESHLPSPLTNGCMASNPHAFAIDPDGIMYKCIDQMGVGKGALCHVSHHEALSAHFDNGPLIDDKCSECSCLPVCMGGCPIHRKDTRQGCNVWKYSLEDVLAAHIDSV